MCRTPRDPNELVAFTMILLRWQDRYLLLERGANKAFAPGRWTGLGGKVEPDEFDDLRASALRELREEAGVNSSEIRRFALRRALINLRPDNPLTVLLYFTGEIDDPEISGCDEGTLHWKQASDFDGLDIIENTGAVLPHLILDMDRDPDGTLGVTTGASAYALDGSLLSIVWSS